MGVITSGQTLTGKVGVAFSQTPDFTGTISSWALASGSSLPAGLSLNGTSGLISGTPTARGDFSSLLDVPLKAISIAAGAYHSLALKSEGTVVGWGGGVFNSGQATVPPELSEVIAIAAGYNHTLALKSNGTVVAWGNNSYGQTTILSGLSGVTAIAAGSFFSLALKNNGTVVGWGGSGYIFNLMVAGIPSGLSGVTAIAARDSHALALKNDGTVVGWGDNSQGQTTIPSGLSEVTAISAGYEHSLALKNDGTVVAWGRDNYGQTTIPTGLSGVTAIAAGYNHSLALKNDGTVVAWGKSHVGQATVPLGLSGVTAIAAGADFSLALKSDGTVVGWGDNSQGPITIPPEHSQSVAFTIAEGVPIITAGQTASGKVGTAFSKTFSLTDSANRPVISWSATGLPNWAVLNTSTGAITGTPQDSGSATITLTATGPGGSDTETAVISIAAGVPIITAGQSFAGKVGEAFAQTPALEDALDRPATSWIATGLPAGLTLNASTGAITGTPTTKGSFTASLTATGGGGTGATTSVSFTIAEGVPIITAGQAASGVVGVAFSKTFSLTDSTNRPVTSWSATGLPPGLSINTSTGAITGTPQDSGSATISLTATGPGGTSAATTATISITAGPPIITAGQSFTGKVGVAFAQTPALEDALDRPATSWSATGLPAGLTLNASTGAITGTPTAKGSFTASFTATGGGGTSAAASIAFTIAEGVPIITAGQTASGVVGVAFSKTFSLTDSANRSVTSWAATGLPSWAALNTTTGAITGTPTAGVSTTISLTATGPGGAGAETVTVAITSYRDPVFFSFPVGQSFSARLAALDEVAVFALSDKSILPPDVFLDSAGIIYGAATAAGVWCLEVETSNRNVVMPVIISLFRSETVATITKRATVNVETWGVACEDARTFTTSSTQNSTVTENPTGVQSVSFAGGKYVAIGSGGVVLTSEDGQSWKSNVTTTTTSSQSVASMVRYGDTVTFSVVFANSSGQILDPKLARIQLIVKGLDTEPSFFKTNYFAYKTMAVFEGGVFVKKYLVTAAFVGGALLSFLSDVESDAGTSRNCLCSFEFIFNRNGEFDRVCSKSFLINVTKDTI